MYIKTEILFDNKGSEFNSGKITRKEVWMHPISKEEALKRFDEGKQVYFIYQNEQSYKTNCRKVCRDREYLIDHYDVYHETCGIACKVDTLYSFSPDFDHNHHVEFKVPRTWLYSVLLKITKRNSMTDVELNKFLKNQNKASNLILYKIARTSKAILEEAVVG